MAAHEKWMPLYVGDYLADTMHLTTRQHGAYLLLLMHSWRSEGRIPDAPAQQAAIARMTPAEWEVEGPAVVAFFNDDCTHERVVKELAIASAVTGQRSKAGKASAAKRQRKANETSTEDQRELNGNPTHVETPLPSRCLPSPSPSVSKDTDTADAASVIFNEGLRWLLAKSARPESYCRSQLGKWRKAIGDAALIEALGAGQREGAMDPMGFMERAVSARAPGKRKPWEKPAKADLPPAEPWEKRMADWRKDGFWNTHSAGPRPGEPGCRVPAAFLDNSPRYSATEAA
jgi:hypothetical protein